MTKIAPKWLEQVLDGIESAIASGNAVNAMLAEYSKRTNKQPGDYLFSTRNGTPLSPTTLRKYALVPLGIPGFHSLRRWRVSYLKSIGTPDSLLKSWIGHSANGNDITARYDKSADDKCSARAGPIEWALDLICQHLNRGGPQRRQSPRPNRL
ncbi:MAG TPA: hypothetical protein VGH37_12390 [Candidatus Acidoferrum sp.]